MKIRLVLLFALLLLVSGCFQRSVKIGVALPLSGASTPRGQEILNAVMLAVEDVNQYGGVQGRKVELVMEDDSDSPEAGRKAAQSLIRRDVIGVVGHYSSDVTLAALPLYIEAETALVSASVSLSRIPAEGETFFRTLGSNALQAEAAARFIQASGFTRIAIVRNPSLYGRDLSERLQFSLKSAKVQQLLLEDGGAAIDQLKNYLPELVFYAGGYQDASRFWARLRETGLQPALMGGNTLHDSEFIRLLGLSAIREVWLTSGKHPPEAFLKRYRQRFGRPGPFSAYAYDAARLLLSAAEQAKTLNAASVRAELAGRQLYQGLTGAILLEPFAAAKAGSMAGFSVLAISPQGQFVPAVPLRPLYGSSGQTAGSWARTALSSAAGVKKPKAEARQP
ncbi:MAG: hypothetical protein CVV27_05280 [Candidatus Melainabacteria bacterium HGW-Melainabacteria-1]|nr:MAG: hypothetical protein CVV27_05280 [Candidatus Melainabacteria bacterium HGW-Melainabacteria-1]